MTDIEKIKNLFDDLNIKYKRLVNNRLEVLCPYHNDNNFGNAFYSVDKNLFYCFACGTGKNLYQIINDVKK